MGEIEVKKKNLLATGFQMNIGRSNVQNTYTHNNRTSRQVHTRIKVQAEPTKSSGHPLHACSYSHTLFTDRSKFKCT